MTFFYSKKTATYENDETFTNEHTTCLIFNTEKRPTLQQSYYPIFVCIESKLYPAKQESIWWLDEAKYRMSS